jgi:hypothetical protein
MISGIFFVANITQNLLGPAPQTLLIPKFLSRETSAGYAKCGASRRDPVIFSTFAISIHPSSNPSSMHNVNSWQMD